MNSFTRLVFVIVVISFFGCSKQIVLPQDVPVDSKPKNIILFIGDGMGLSHITAHIYQQGGSLLEEFNNIGLIKTHASDNLITDSGASATAMACGIKTSNFAVGMNEDEESQPNILEIAKDAGFRTGIVTTSSLMDATPAAFYAHRINRYYQDSVAKDLSNSNIDFLLGGGLGYFKNESGESSVDIEVLKNNGFKIYDWENLPIELLSTRPSNKCIYFSGKAEPNLNVLGLSHLNKASEKAISHLNRNNEKGFILLIEEAQIDWASHNAKDEALINRMTVMERTLKRVLNFVKNNKETLLILTADHSTGGLTVVEGSEPGDVSLEFSTNAHTAAMVPVFAYGPGSEKFRGVYENSDIFHKMIDLLSLKKPMLAKK